MACDHPRNINHFKVPCRQCLSCMKDDLTQWSKRLEIEGKGAKTAYFITLTYSDDNLPLDLNLDKTHLQLFFKRLRKTTKEKLRYYAVGEYGEKYQRPHYHVILFNYPFDSILKLSRKFQEVWKNGTVQVERLNKTLIDYVTKYIFIRQNWIKIDGVQSPYRVMSLKPPIGANYVNEKTILHHNILDKTYITEEERKVKLPEIYKKKLFSDEKLKDIREKSKEYYNKKQDEEYLNDWHGDRQIREQKEKSKLRMLKKSAINTMDLPVMGAKIHGKLTGLRSKKCKASKEKSEYSIIKPNKNFYETI